MSPDDYISVRDWRRKPAMRLRVTKKVDIWPPANDVRRDPANRPLYRVRQERRGAPAPELERLGHGLGADAGQLDGVIVAGRSVASPPPGASPTLH
jgi:hypothetical protein